MARRGGHGCIRGVGLRCRESAASTTLRTRTRKRRRGMKRSVPTLLGAFALIVVATLAVLVYNIRLADKLAQGLTPSGTVGGQVLTGVDAPTELLAPRPADTAAVAAARQGAGVAAVPVAPASCVGRRIRARHR